MGFLGAAFGVGFILGPAVGGALSSFSPRAPFLFGAAVAAVNLVLAFARLPETRPAGAPAERPRATLGALKDPQFAPLYALGFLATFAFSNMESTLALLVARRHGFDARAAGMLFAYVGVLLVLMQGVVVGRLARRFGEARLIVAGTLLMAAGLFCAPHAPTVALLCAVLALLAFGSGLFNPSLSSLVSRRAAAAERGGALGLLQSMVAAARVVGPASAGFLFEHRGTEWPYLVGGAVMLLACVLGAGVLLRRTI
jgi:MFS family permease